MSTDLNHTEGPECIGLEQFERLMTQYGVEPLSCSTIVDGMPPECARRLHPDLGEKYHGPDIYGNTDTGYACELIKEAAKQEPGFLTSIQVAAASPLAADKDDQPVQPVQPIQTFGEFTV